MNSLLQRMSFSHPQPSSPPPQTHRHSQSNPNDISALLADNPQSPNAIPPRTSSTGVAGTNGSSTHSSPRSHTAAKRPSTTVLRPISETTWLSQGKRASVEALGKSSKDQRMASPQRNTMNFDPVDTVPGPARERDLSAAYEGAQHESPKSHRFTMAEPLPHRTSSKHRLSSSLESKASSKAAASHSTRSAFSPPPPDPLKYADDLIHQRQRSWSADKERVLLGPYNYLLNHPGKDIRAQLIGSFNQWLKVPEESLAVITKVVGMLHTASLLYVSSSPFSDFN